MKKQLLILSGIFLAICLSINTFAQTAGTLTVTFTEPTPTSPPVTSGSNILAVWIEDNSGTFIKTKMRFVGSVTKDHLPTWAAKSGGTATNATSTACNTTDAKTGATLKASTTPTAFGSKTITWDGKNVSGTTNGTTVADGIYKVWVESSWNDGTPNIHNAITSFSFTKGPNPDHQTPANSTFFTNITLDWLPATTNIDEANSEAPKIAVSPNPSTNGIFNVDFNKATSIKIINTLGITVYNEKIDQAGAGTRSIDLSNFANGIYMINVMDGNASSNFKVILNK